MGSTSSKTLYCGRLLMAGHSVTFSLAALSDGVWTLLQTACPNPHKKNSTSNQPSKRKKTKKAQKNAN